MLYNSTESKVQSVKADDFLATSSFRPSVERIITRLRGFYAKMADFAGIKNLIYLDFASTTPMEPRVLRLMNRISKHEYWNPGGLYAQAQHTRTVIQNYRSRLQTLLHAPNHQVLFVRGGTESCNLAFHSAWQQWRISNPDVIPTVITSPIEHSSVRTMLNHFAQAGHIRLVELPIDTRGIVSAGALQELLSPEVMYVTIQMVNNETGVIQPIKKLSHIVRDYRRAQGSGYPLLHTDAIQSPCTTDIHVQSLNVDYLSLSASKFYGPKSGGILAVHNRITTGQMIWGGEQESGWRPGTEDVALIAGTVHAYEITCKRRESEIPRLTALRNFLAQGIASAHPDIICNTPDGDSSPHILNISIPGYDSEFAVLHFDAAGIAVASGSACSAYSGAMSHVITSLWQAHERPDPNNYAHIRISLGRVTNAKDIDRFLIALQKLRSRVYKRT